MQKFFKTEEAFSIWDRSYRNGNETPKETFERIARELAKNEVNTNPTVTEENYEELYNEFLSCLVVEYEDGTYGLKNTTGGRITANIGTDFAKATLINCFVTGPVSKATITYDRHIPNTDVDIPIVYETPDNPDNLMNIFLTIMEQAKTLASEGGYGINFDFIRPRGSIIKGIGIEHPGIVQYMKIWDQVARCIVSGNNDGYVDTLTSHLTEEEITELTVEVKKKMARKGAMMGVLSIDHPDIEEFVRAKQTSGELTLFNISVAVTDAFMEALLADEMWELRFEDKVYKRVKARELWDLIMQSTYNRAEPGIIFVDNAMKKNPISYLGKVNATNPSLHKDTLVITNKGVFPIVELDGRDDFKVLNFRNEWQNCKAFKTGDKKQLYKISFNDGSDIYCTPEHKWPILKNIRSGDKRTIGYDSFKKVRTDEMKSNSKILFPQNINPFITSDCTFNKDDGFILGWNIGDGSKSFHKRKNTYQYDFIVGNADIEVSGIIEDYINNIIKDNISFRPSTKGKSVETSSSDISIRTLFDSFGYTKKEDGIPSSVWKGDTNFISGFIDGLFSSDGCIDISNKRIIFTTKHEKLAKDLQKLLSFFGIGSKVRYSEATSTFPNEVDYDKIYGRYDLVIRRRSIKLFREIFTLSSKRKNDLLDKLCEVDYKYEDKIHKIVTSVELTDIYEDVYDITVFDDTHTFMCEGGVITGNCGEVPGNPATTTTCLLGSTNITQYVRADRTFDWEMYEKDVATFTKMLDNVNDISKVEMPTYLWAIENLRQIGVGINGFGSALLMLGIPYDSKEANDFATRLWETKENITWQTSAKMAAEKGTFPVYDKEQFTSTEFYNDGTLWPETKKMIEEFGVRNAKTTMNAPLGSTSMLCDYVSNGIEPVFSIETERKVTVDKWPQGLTKDNIKSILNATKEGDADIWRGEYDGVQYYFEPHNRGLCQVKYLRDYGYQWILDNFGEEEANNTDYIRTTRDLGVDDHVSIQAIAQKFTNQAISKTINLPNDYSFEDFSEVYINSWKKGLIGTTTYREGSMESVLATVEENATDEPREIIEVDLKLPDEFINGPTQKIKREGNKYYIHMSYHPEDVNMSFPVAIWIKTNATKGETVSCNRAAKSLIKLAMEKGIDPEIVSEAGAKAKIATPHDKLARMISLNMRHNVDLVDILESISSIEGDHISSLLTAVRKFISSKIPDGVEAKGATCVECGSDNIKFESGCHLCIDCGYSGCA
jgi:ribonucleoside-diphosphate reductase alpha chain